MNTTFIVTLLHFYIVTFLHCYLIIIGACLLAFAAWMLFHQRKLRQRARIMQEAIRNHDFMFRLPTDGLLFGERAMQEALNQLGDTIRQQVSRNEVMSWERLTRVLTHEIMNSMAPIVSLSQTLSARPDVQGTPLEDGVRTIHATSSHLLTFVENYRKMSQLQQPHITTVRLVAVVADVSNLYPDVQWHIDIPSSCTVDADEGMLRQTLGNLVKNACEAGAKMIGVEFDPSRRLYVSNDGAPIAADARSSIFVPFFTTKPSGYGIGLSLSRQMMVSQGGMLELSDTPRPGYSTTFVLDFR